LSGTGRNVVSLASRRGLTSRSGHWDCRTRVELVSAAYDPDYEGIGSSPVVGDLGGTGIRVPATATVDQRHRYLFRLCGKEIPAGKMMIVRGLRQLVTLRADYTITGEVPGQPLGTFVFEREVTSPGWHFNDGNVSFHLKYTTQVQSVRSVFDPLQLPGTSPSTFGVDTAFLYTPNPLGPFLGPYNPPGAGIPPGRDVDWLGTLRDVRYPWDNTDWSLSVPCYGPGVVTLWASVFQTNPTTRIAPPQQVPPAPWTDPISDAYRPEDLFLIQHPTCKYGRVGGALLLDLYPDVFEGEKDVR
jgi:hypothetical protein